MPCHFQACVCSQSLARGGKADQSPCRRVLDNGRNPLRRNHASHQKQSVENLPYGDSPRRANSASIGARRVSGPSSKHWKKDGLHLARPKLWQDLGNQSVSLTEGLCAVAHRLECVFHTRIIAEHKEDATVILTFQPGGLISLFNCFCSVAIC